MFSPKEASRWQKCGTIEPQAFKGAKANIEVDISGHIEKPGQFLIRFDDVGHSGTVVEDIEVFYDGHAVHEKVLSAVKQGEIYLLNRHAQIVEQSKIVLKVKLHTQANDGAKMDISIKRIL